MTRDIMFQTGTMFSCFGVGSLSSISCCDLETRLCLSSKRATWKICPLFLLPYYTSVSLTWFQLLDATCKILLARHLLALNALLSSLTTLLFHLPDFNYWMAHVKYFLPDIYWPQMR